jgi:hypothetical protein
MEDENEIPPSLNPPEATRKKDETSAEDQMANADERVDSSSFNMDSIPHYEELRAILPPGATSKDIATFYSEHLEHVLGFSWELDEQAHKAMPTLPPPSLVGGKNGEVSTGQLAEGVFINVPRCSKNWHKDQLKMRWGKSTFYTTVPPPQKRNEPRLTQFLTADGIPNDRTGLIDIRYEVVRRSRLVGVSETLTVYVRDDGEGQPCTSYGRPTRRRKLDL